MTIPDYDRLLRVRTLGELKRSGYQVLPVKEEIRRNLLRKLRKGETLFPGILGYDRTVIPQLVHALLAKHDIILLGLRGQAKSRIIRLLPEFLDEYVPVLEGSETNDNPFEPISRYGRRLVQEAGDDAPIAWLHRSQRYGEKLATPDTTIADLIGDIDPIKAATRRLTYADEEVMHFGLIPRMNRGIFAINELPDLAPRIQVGLLNILQERDVQIRGFPVRLPLDILMVFSANPEDYTNRGSIITPLKDRIDSQILTHYPRSLEVALAITEQEAWTERGLVRVHTPHIYREIIEQIAFEARQSEFVDQKSGVSTRLPIAACENLISSVERRAVRNSESEAAVRVSDLYHTVPAITGKLELVYEGEQEGPLAVARLLIGRAIKARFVHYFPDPNRKPDGRRPYQEILDWFAQGNTLSLPDDLPQPEYQKRLESVPGLSELVCRHTRPGNDLERLSMMELVLEALHQHSLLGKRDLDDEHAYVDLVGTMLTGLRQSDADADEDDEERSGKSRW
ncbi:MAG: magnesium chelatase [Bacteroidetes bacterium]|nr:magnesium chelatase [Bacteroidota bacterium]